MNGSNKPPPPENDAKKAAPTPEEQWNALLDFAADEEIDEVMAMSESELNDELRAAGVDPIGVGKRGAELAARLLAREHPGAVPPPPASAPKLVPASRGSDRILDRGNVAEAMPAASTRGERRGPRRKPFTPYLLAAAIILLAIGAAALLRRSEDVPPPPPPQEKTAPSGPLPEQPPPTDRIAANALRTLAEAECDRSAWISCLNDLDRAATIDPEGDTLPGVQALRARAKRGDSKLRAPTP